MLGFQKASPLGTVGAKNYIFLSAPLGMLFLNEVSTSENSDPIMHLKAPKLTFPEMYTSVLGTGFPMDHSIRTIHQRLVFVLEVGIVLGVLSLYPILYTLEPMGRNSFNPHCQENLSFL